LAAGTRLASDRPQERARCRQAAETAVFILDEVLPMSFVHRPHKAPCGRAGSSRYYGLLVESLIF